MSNKVEATYHGGEYVPRTETVRELYGQSGNELAFDHWLATVKAEAWDEGREAGSENQIHWNGNWYTGGHEEITNPYKDAS